VQQKPPQTLPPPRVPEPQRRQRTTGTTTRQTVAAMVTTLTRCMRSSTCALTASMLCSFEHLSQCHIASLRSALLTSCCVLEHLPQCHRASLRSGLLTATVVPLPRFVAHTITLHSAAFSQEIDEGDDEESAAAAFDRAAKAMAGEGGGAKAFIAAPAFTGSKAGCVRPFSPSRLLMTFRIMHAPTHSLARTHARTHANTHTHARTHARTHQFLLFFFSFFHFFVAVHRIFSRVVESGASLLLLLLLLTFGSALAYHFTCRYVFKMGGEGLGYYRDA
jgi:hypothetical protein